MSITEIQAAASALSAEDRADLAASILDTLDSADPNDSDGDSLTESHRRSEELATGRVIAISEAELLDEIRAERKK